MHGLSLEDLRWFEIGLWCSGGFKENEREHYSIWIMQDNKIEGIVMGSFTTDTNPSICGSW